MEITIFILALVQIMGLISSVHAVLRTRTAQGAIAWVVSLNTISPIAVPAYWVFGRSKFQGYVHARRDSMLNIDSERAEILITDHFDSISRSLVSSRIVDLRSKLNRC
jgi:cardiolipin synthase